MVTFLSFPPWPDSIIKAIEYPVGLSNITAGKAREIEDQVYERLVKEMRKAPAAKKEESEEEE